MYIAYTGARAAEKKIEQIANNLANVSSAGFKQDRTVASGVVPLVFATGTDPVSLSGETPGANLLYATPAVHFTDHAPGTMRATGNPYDLAIDGDAFFTVRTPDGKTRLTRAGNFRVGTTGELVTPSGAKLLGAGGPIHAGQGKVSVAQDGQVSVDGAVVGTLRIQKVSDPQRLVKRGNSLFEVPADLPLQPAGADVTVMQGMLEESNVNPVAGMTDLIEVSRVFEAYMKMMTTVSDIASKATNDLGRV